MWLALLAGICSASPMLEIGLEVGDGAFAEAVDDGMIVLHQVRGEPYDLLLLDHDLDGLRHTLDLPEGAQMLGAQRTGQTLALWFETRDRRGFLVRARVGQEPSIQPVTLHRSVGDVWALLMHDEGAYLQVRSRGARRLLFLPVGASELQEVMLAPRHRIVDLREAHTGGAVDVALRRGRRLALASVQAGVLGDVLDVSSQPGEARVVSAWRSPSADGVLVVGRVGGRRTTSWYIARYRDDRRVRWVKVDLPQSLTARPRVLEHDLQVHAHGVVLSGEVVRRTMAAGRLRESPANLGEVLRAWKTSHVVALRVSNEGAVTWTRASPLESAVFPTLRRRVDLRSDGDDLVVQHALDGVLRVHRVSRDGSRETQRWQGVRLPGDVDLATYGTVLAGDRAMLWGTHAQPGGRSTFFVEVISSTE